MEKVKFGIKFLDDELRKVYAGVYYKTSQSAGFDIRANEAGVIGAGAVAMVKTGLVFETPIGFEVQVRTRSGLAVNNGIFLLNSPGTIDSDYRGEVQLIVANFSKIDFEYKKYDRLAQAVLCKYYVADVVEYSVNDTLTNTERGSGGFGSTGLS